MKQMASLAVLGAGFSGSLHHPNAIDTVRFTQAIPCLDTLRARLIPTACKRFQ